jgi:hypothetical protein
MGFELAARLGIRFWQAEHDVALTGFPRPAGSLYSNRQRETNKGTIVALSSDPFCHVHRPFPSTEGPDVYVDSRSAAPQ